MDYIETLIEAINFIEENLNEDLSYEDVANHCAISPYHFMRIFKGVTSLTLTEYIRSRQLYQSILLLSNDSSLRIIDVAYMFHYSNPESYTKAFVKYCGASPTKARKDHHLIKPFLPLVIGDIIKGGNIMDYVIEEKKEFSVIGLSRRFKFDEGYKKIPEFWDESIKVICNEKYLHFDLIKKTHIGEFGICINDSKSDFEYLIAGEYNGENVPSGYVVKKIPSSLWARFRVVGPLPGSLQSINTKIWNEWLPAHKEYELSLNIDVEYYSYGNTNDKDYICEIWLPIKLKEIK